MVEARSEPRDECRIPASILAGDRIVGCRVEDLSENGAKLVLDEDVELPSAFALELPVFEALSHRRSVERRWQLGRNCGVRFVDTVISSA